MSLQFNRRSLLRGMLGGIRRLPGLAGPRRVPQQQRHGIRGRSEAAGAVRHLLLGAWSDRHADGRHALGADEGRSGLRDHARARIAEVRQGQGLGVLRFPRDRRRARESRPLERPCFDPVRALRRRRRAASTDPRSTPRSRTRSAAATRFKVIDVDASMSRQPVSYSTRTGRRSPRRKPRRSRSTRACSATVSRIRTATIGNPIRRSCCVRACCRPSPISARR